MCAAPIYGGIHWILYLPTVWSYFKMCPIDMFLVFINFYYCNSNTSMSCFLIYIRIKSSQVWKHYSAPSIAVQQNSFDKQWKYSLVATLPLIKIPYLIKHSNMLKSWENREFFFKSVAKNNVSHFYTPSILCVRICLLAVKSQTHMLPLQQIFFCDSFATKLRNEAHQILIFLSLLNIFLKYQCWAYHCHFAFCSRNECRAISIYITLI